MSWKIRSITINTPQPEKMLRFYEVLGFNFQTRSVDKGTQLWSARSVDQACEFVFIQAPSSKEQNALPYLQIDLLIKDVSLVAQQLRDLGAFFMMDPSVMASGKVEAIVQDPDGNIVRLYPD